MWFGLITLFPEMFQALHVGVTGRAIKDRLFSLNCYSPRDFATDKHQTVDDKPYGGGAGMVMMAEPLQDAILAAKAACPTPATVIYLSPQGRQFNQAAAERMATLSSIIFVAGRYEGVDERLIKAHVDEEWTIGDYILTGGELAAMTMIDAISRNLPGVVGDNLSVSEDSLATGLLKYPQYTRPELFNNESIPPILLSGHHANIKRWRRMMSLGRTWQRRPDLLAKLELSKEDQKLLDEFQKTV